MLGDISNEQEQYVGYVLRMEGRRAPRSWLWPRRARSVDHRAALPVHRARPRPRRRRNRQIVGHSRSALGRIRDLLWPTIRQNRSSQGLDPGDPAVLADVGSLRHGFRPNGSDSDSRAHGRDGGELLPDQLHRGRRRLEAGAPRVQSRPAAERFCIARIRARSDHRDAAIERRAVMALGVLDRRDPGFHHRRAACSSSCASRKTRRRAS